MAVQERTTFDIDILRRGDVRAAATVTCELTTGRRVVTNVILDLCDGRIARELVTAARDPQASAEAGR